VATVMAVNTPLAKARVARAIGQMAVEAVK
jgi:hypothetical protein